MAQTQSA